MYPLLPLGPLNLSSGGLLLMLGLVLAVFLFERTARRRGGPRLAEQAASCVYPALAGALIGGRLWYGLFNWDLYGPNPILFLELRVGALAWPGALAGGMLAGWLWCRWRGHPVAPLADVAALALPPAQLLASIGLLLSGEAFGQPTSVPWGIELFGTTRHPTQLYFALAALLSYGALRWLARRDPPAGGLGAAYLGLQGLTLLLVEPLRADSLVLPYGLRAAQVAGLGLLMAALSWWRARQR